MNHRKEKQMSQICIFIGYTLLIIAYLFYMREIRSGSTVAPNPVSWLIFGLISLSNGVILFGKISLLILFFPFLMGIAQFTIAYLSWHKREGQIESFDISALIIGILALISWVSFQNIVPEYWWVSVMLIFIADLVGFLPTLRDAWYHPENDDVSTWMIFSLVGILVLIGIMLDKGNTLMDMAYPLYETILALSTSCILFFRKK